MRMGKTAAEGFGPYGWTFIIAQSTLPAESRLPEIQAVFDEENTRAALFLEARAEILQASTPADLYNLASPWFPVDVSTDP
jgi:hypothetical protein